MNKQAVKEDIKYAIKAVVPKRLIFNKKKTSWLNKKAERLNRDKSRHVKSAELTAYFGGSYKNIANYLKEVNISSDGYYFYSIDEYKYIRNDKYTLENLSPNYAVFFEPLEKVEKDFKHLKNSKYIFDALYSYIERTTEYLKAKDDFNGDSSRTHKQYEYICRIKTKKVESFDEALQRILFFNGIIWQTEHRLVGFGPLDRMLEKYYLADIKNHVETKESIKDKITLFCKATHEHYVYKSNNLIGDTGQIIQLSGYDSDKHTFISELDYLFIEVVKELQLPDPKILLRVTKDTPKDLYKLSLECIETGIGCPLFANDDVIIPAMISAGYNKNEAYDYSTSACWEPMIHGASADQNNQTNIVPVNVLNRVLNKNIEYDTFNELLDAFKAELKIELDKLVLELKYRRYALDPMLTLMTADCKKKQLDITKGGVRYFNYGYLTVSFANFINSLFIIKKYKYDERKYSLSELNNFRKKEKFDKITSEKKFGKDDKEVVSILNDIMEYMSKYFEGKKNYYGGNYNIGLSSPSYVDQGKDAEASLDGRKKGDPFSTHISADGPLAYTELFNFAGKLNYSKNRYNGNVIDFMVSKSFLSNNFDKFVDFLILSQKTGYFEMQMNVTSSKILIEAKKNPEKFPNLIVRVWGFSSYFNDLPEEYKDLLIKRALKSEGK